MTEVQRDGRLSTAFFFPGLLAAIFQLALSNLPRLFQRRFPNERWFGFPAIGLLGLPGSVLTNDVWMHIVGRARMLSYWRIRSKLTLCLALLLVAVVFLSLSGLSSIYRYRSLARGVSRRAEELPYATAFAEHVSNLRVAVIELSHRDDSRESPSESPSHQAHNVYLKQGIRDHLTLAQRAIANYRDLFQRNQQIEERDWRASSEQEENRTLMDIEFLLGNIHEYTDTNFGRDDMNLEFISWIDELQNLSVQLPKRLQDRMRNFRAEVKADYRSAFILTIGSSVGALGLMGVMAQLLYVWILKPFRQILHGSRRVAGGEYSHRIHLESKDEMRELAEAMNMMTQGFCDIRDDLDQKVRVGAKQVAKSERLASVGFLAAGIAHEINNPLQSIAGCAESLEERLDELIQEDDELPDEDHNPEISVLRKYLRMIQDEAFRCKGITSKLLDFARMGDCEKHAADLTKIVETVVDMLGHLGEYKAKKIDFEAAGPVIADVNEQEIKQVVLNLLTNSLDSLGAGGIVKARVTVLGELAQIRVVDNGCGMTEEVLEHIFEPFFTRRRDGKGTGLGMSITYGIVRDHGGEIEAHSEGVGKGSTFTVTIPLSGTKQKENRHQYQAA